MPTKRLIRPLISLLTLTGIIGFLSSSNSQKTEIVSHQTPNEETNLIPISEINETKDIEESEIPDTEKEKEKIRAQAKEALGKLNDYTFRIFSPCGVGTGWVLDYEIPKDNQEYPTTWYIATNAHVLSKFRFSSNPYNQILPISDSETRHLRNKYRGIDHSHLSLWDNTVTCQSTEWYGYLDMNISQQAWGEKEKADYGAVAKGKMKEPKLFYAAFNYLDKGEKTGINYDHFLDFAVLELEFNDEESARKATGDFAKKYTLESNNTIGLFDKPLEAKYSKEELDNLTENFYHLAYPHKQGDKWNYSTNFDETNAVAGQLVDKPWDWWDPNKKYLRGFVEAKQIMPDGLVWNGKQYREAGHFYKLKNIALGAGSSGGLFTDSNGNAIGIISIVATNAPHSWVAPFRSVGFVSDKFKTPAYDLILGGVEGQRTSYKQQVEEFNKNTWLKAKGWNNKS